MRALIVLSLMVLAAPLLAAERPILLDRVVAVVNNDVITLSELNEATAAAERQLLRQGTGLPDHEVLRRQTLERLILKKAELQRAHDDGIRASDLEVDRAVERIAENNNLTLADFRQALQRDGVAFDAFRKDVHDQILLQRLREREVDDRIQVSDNEVDLYLEEHKSQAQSNVEYDVAQILVRVPDQASPEQLAQARARAEKARAEAVASGDFARVAAAYSDASDALQGGALGWRARNRLPQLFTDALERLKPGEVSPVLRSPAGFHVLKLLGRRAATDDNKPVVQTHVRHILIRPNEVVSEAEARRRLLDLRERIVRGGQDFGELARTHSDDDASAANGGDLGWLYPGDTVPAFQRAYEALKVGEVSQPVKTPFGYHLIQVLGRRTGEMSQERRRQQARQILRERKADEAYQEWLRQIRDSAYVELHLEDR